MGLLSTFAGQLTPHLISKHQRLAGSHLLTLLHRSKTTHRLLHKSRQFLQAVAAWWWTYPLEQWQAVLVLRLLSPFQFVQVKTLRPTALQWCELQRRRALQFQQANAQNARR